MALEEKFDLEIPDEEAENIKTVSDAVKYIEDKTKVVATAVHATLQFFLGYASKSNSPCRVL